MNSIQLTLPLKHASFLLCAIEAYIQSLEGELQTYTTEDRAAEISNDLPLFISMKHEIEEKIQKNS